MSQPVRTSSGNGPPDRGAIALTAWSSERCRPYDLITAVQLLTAVRQHLVRPELAGKSTRANERMVGTVPIRAANMAAGHVSRDVTPFQKKQRPLCHVQ